MSQRLPMVYLVRHGETEWSKSGRHSGRKDLALTDEGEAQARAIGARLGGRQFAHVWVSPLRRAKRTCELAGFGDRAVEVPELQEWDYGDYQGRTAAEIRADVPDWFLFTHGCPAGESMSDVGVRADRVLDRLRQATGDVILFAHGHILRVLGARWLGLPADAARFFLLGTAGLSVLGYEHDRRDEPIFRLWNDRSHLES